MEQTLSSISPTELYGRLGTAAALCLLMVGAVGSHLKARDKAAAALPAAITGMAAVALLPLALVA